MAINLEFYCIKFYIFINLFKIFVAISNILCYNFIECSISFLYSTYNKAIQKGVLFMTNIDNLDTMLLNLIQDNIEKIKLTTPKNPSIEKDDDWRREPY